MNPVTAMRIRKLLWAVLVCMALAVAGLGLLLATEKGRQTLLDTIATLTATPEFALKMEGLRLGQTWSLKHLTISDASGPWLEGEDLNARPLLSALLKGRISLLHAGASRLEITRQPATGGGPQASHDPALPSLRIQSVRIDQLHIGPGLIGHEASLALRGGLTLDRDSTGAALRLTRLDRPKDALELDARLSLPEKALDLRLDLHEEPQGLLHAALGMNGTQGISVRVVGQGPLKQWNGTLTALLSDVARLDGNATLALDADSSADLQALITPGPAWSRFTNLPHEALTVTSRGQWRDSVLHISRFDLQSASGTAHGNATWDMKTGTLDSAASAQADLSWLLPASVTAAPLSASAALRLDQEGVHAQGNIAARDMTVSGLAVPGAETRFSLFFPAETKRWQAQVRLDAQTPTLPTGLRAWSANATLGQDAASFYAQDLHVESDRLALAANGTLDSLIRMDARIALRDFPSNLTPRPLSAILDTRIQGHMDLPASSVNASLDLAAVEIDGLAPELMQLLGQDSRLQARLSLSPQLLHLHEARLSARTKANASGRFDLGNNTFQASLSATLPEIRTDALSVTPGASLDAKASGKPDSFALDLSAAAKSIRFGEWSVTGIKAKALAPDLPSRAAATLRAQALAGQEPVSLELRVEPVGKVVRFADCVLRAPETTLSFSGDIDPGTLLIKGVMGFESTDLSALGRIMNMELGGQSALQAVLDAQQGRQRIALKGQGQGMTIGALRVGQTTLEGRLADPGLPDGTDLRIGLRSAGMEDVLADSMDVRLRGMDAGFGFDIDLIQKSSDTHLSSSGEFSSDLTRLDLKTLHGTLLRQPLALEAPFEITSTPSGVAWRKVGLDFGPSRLRSQGSLSPGQADINAEVTDFDPALLRLLSPHLPSAEVTARLRVTGNPSQPDAHLEAVADAIRLEGSGRELPGGLDATADIRLSQNLLRAQAALKAKSEIAINAQASGPMRVDLFALEFDGNSPVSGQIAGRAKLMLLPHFLRLDDQVLDGDCDLDLHVGGTWTAPLFTGTAQVRDARYENFRTGTMLADLSMDAQAQGSTLMTKLSATDGGKGKVEAVGQVDLLTFRHIFDVLFDRFELLRQDLVQSTARGGLRLQGNLDRTKLGGSVTLDPTSVRLPAKTPADLAHIEVQEINTASARQADPADTSVFPVDLDLRVAVPARLSVQGRGLDSEWSGNLHIGGTRNQPIITGEMNLLRGTFIFLDRSFDLTKGSLALNGENPPNPFLEMIGETQVLENLIQVRINGPARDFRLTLSSVPALPQDELLAMVLFGRSLRQISPLQAVRLAQAAAEMTGVGAGPDFLDSIKTRLGLQEVDVTKDEDDNTSVGVGGYLGGKYYIRTQSSVSGQDRTKVEVQITPKISVETEVGADSRQGGGVTWKHDY